MINYVKSNRSLEIDCASGTVTKLWKPAWIERRSTAIAPIQWLQNHVSMLNVVIPDEVISFGCRNESVYVVFKYIDGPTLDEWTLATYKDNPALVADVWEQAAKFWVDSMFDTFPYSHWSWTSSNTVVVSQDPFQFRMIDWDGCRIASLVETRERLIECLAFAEAKATKNIPQAKYLYSATRDAAVNYFDVRVKEKYGALP